LTKDNILTALNLRQAIVYVSPSGENY
jgi:hypothetical protein